MCPKAKKSYAYSTEKITKTAHAMVSFHSCMKRIRVVLLEGFFGTLLQLFIQTLLRRTTKKDVGKEQGLLLQLDQRNLC